MSSAAFCERERNFTFYFVNCLLHTKTTLPNKKHKVSIYLYLRLRVSLGWNIARGVVDSVLITEGRGN